MKCEFEEFTWRLGSNAVAFVVIVLLLFPGSTSVLCIAPGSHVEIEDINNLCCLSSGISAQSGYQTDSGFNGPGNCQNCTDLPLVQNSREVISQSSDPAASSLIADACLENLLSTNVFISQYRSGTIGNIDTSIPVYSSIPLRC